MLVLATAQLVPLLEVLDQRVEFIAYPVKISHPVLSDLPWSTAGGPRAESQSNSMRSPPASVFRG